MTQGNNLVLQAAVKTVLDSGVYHLSKVISAETIKHYEYSGDPSSAYEVLIGLALDTETTGKSVMDKIVQLSMVRFEFCAATGAVLRVLARYDSYNDPGIPIPAEATAVNGITDAMVKGHKIDQKEVAGFFQGVNVVLAHNAQFDRPVMENNLTEISDVLANSKWACTLNDIKWAEYGYATAKLDYLMFKHGFTYEAHRSDIDTEALLVLLDQPAPDGDPYLKEAYLASTKNSHKIWAVGSPFSTKDILKERGYHWNGGEDGGQKAWFISVDDEHKADELKWLEQNVYRRPGLALVDSFNATTRYSVLGDEFRAASAVEVAPAKEDLPAPGSNFGLRF